mgnify:CR=1 FL=1
MAISYNPNIFVPFHTIGGSGGSDFSWVNGTNGNLIKKLEVWSGGWQLRGIKVTLTNGESRTFGKLEDRYQGSLELAPGELITKLSIWGNGAGTRTGAFRMETNKGQVFFPKMYDWGLKTEYVMDVGSGLLAGIYGGANSDIDRLGFAFLLPIRNSVLKDVSYPTLAAYLVATTPFTIDQITIDNLQGTVSQGAVLKNSQSFTVSREWSNSTALEVSITSSVSASIPLVADVSVETSVSLSNVYSFGRSESETIERGVDHNVTCPPGQMLRATATTYQDKLDIPYNGRFEVEIQSTGAKFSYSVSGNYKGVSVRSVFVKYEVLQTAKESAEEESVVKMF